MKEYYVVEIGYSGAGGDVAKKDLHWIKTKIFGLLRYFLRA